MDYKTTQTNPRISQVMSDSSGVWSTSTTLHILEWCLKYEYNTAHTRVVSEVRVQHCTYSSGVWSTSTTLHIQHIQYNTARTAHTVQHCTYSTTLHIQHIQYNTAHTAQHCTYSTYSTTLHVQHIAVYCQLCRLLRPCIVLTETLTNRQ
jgi:hypothetical protein